MVVNVSFFRTIWYSASSVLTGNYANPILIEDVTIMSRYNCQIDSPLWFSLTTIRLCEPNQMQNFILYFILYLEIMLIVCPKSFINAERARGVHLGTWMRDMHTFNIVFFLLLYIFTDFFSFEYFCIKMRRFFITLFYVNSVTFINYLNLKLLGTKFVFKLW